MLSDGNTNSASTDTGYVQAYNNIVTATSSYGMAISSGHDDLITNNIVISSGVLPDGTKIAALKTLAFMYGIPLRRSILQERPGVWKYGRMDGAERAE